MPGMMDTILNLGLNDKTVRLYRKKPQTKDLLKIVTEIYSNVCKCGDGSGESFI